MLVFSYVFITSLSGSFVYLISPCSTFPNRSIPNQTPWLADPCRHLTLLPFPLLLHYLHFPTSLKYIQQERHSTEGNTLIPVQPPTSSPSSSPRVPLPLSRDPGGSSNGGRRAIFEMEGSQESFGFFLLIFSVCRKDYRRERGFVGGMVGIGAGGMGRKVKLRCCCC